MKKFLKIFKRIWIPLYGILFVLLVIFSVSAAKFEMDKKPEARSKKSEVIISGRVTGIATTNQNQSQESGARSQKPGKTTNAETTTITKSKQIAVSSKQTTQNPSSTNPPIVKNVDMVYLKINSGPAAGYYQDDFVAGENAFSLMQRIVEKYHFAIKFTDYGGDLGKYVDCIGGLCHDSDYNPSWMLYYNGSMSSVGASSLIVGKNDVVEWRFESY